MKHFALALGLSLLFCNVSTRAQENKPAADDSTAIRTTVRDYIEAYYTGDAQRMQQTLHPHYLKHMIHGGADMRERTAAQMVGEVRKNGVPTDLPAADRTEQVIVLDIAGEIAEAKLVTPHWVDYMTLAKTEAGWKILSVVQRIDN
jgi:hypothetical protein